MSVGQMVFDQNTFGQHDSWLVKKSLSMVSWPNVCWSNGLWPKDIWSTQHLIGWQVSYYAVLTKCLSVKWFLIKTHLVNMIVDWSKSLSLWCIDQLSVGQMVCDQKTFGQHNIWLVDKYLIMQCWPNVCRSNGLWTKDIWSTWQLMSSLLCSVDQMSVGQMVCDQKTFGQHESWCLAYYALLNKCLSVKWFLTKRQETIMEKISRNQKCHFSLQLLPSMPKLETARADPW